MGFFRRGPSNGTSGVVVTRTCSLSTYRYTIYRTRRDPTRYYLCNALNLIRYCVHCKTFIRYHAMFFARHIDMYIPYLFTFHRSTVRTRIGPLRSGDLFRVLLSIVDGPCTSTTLFRCTRPSAFILCNNRSECQRRWFLERNFIKG